MKKSFVVSSLSAAVLAGLLLVNSNTKVEAAKADGQDGATEQKNTTSVDTAKADVQSAQATVDSAQNDVVNKEKALEQAKTANAGPIDAYNDQDKQVQDAQKNVNQKQADLKAAQEVAKNATPEKIAQTEQDLTNAQNKKTSDEATLEVKKNDRNQKQTAYDTAKRAAEDAATAVSNKQTVLNTAKQTASDKQTALATAKTNLQNEQNSEHVNPNKIVIDSAYKTAILNAQNFAEAHVGQVLPADLQNAIKTAGAHLLTENRYQSVAADKAQAIDFNNITAAQLKEIRIYYLQLINNLREQLGEQPLKFNNSAMRMSDEIAQKYEQDNWDGTLQGHDLSALRAGYSAVGMPRTFEEAMGFFTKGELPDYDTTVQNDDSSYNIKTTSNDEVTMDDVKNNIYGVVNNMLFNDKASNWGHAMSLTHPHSKFMGFSISRHGNTLTFHMNPVNPANITEPARFNQNDNISLDNSTTVATLQAAVDAANTAYEAAETAATAAKTAYDNAVAEKKNKDDAVSAAKTALDDAKKAVDSADKEVKADGDKIESLHTLLTTMRNPAVGIRDAEAAVTAAKTALQNEQNQLNALKPAKDTAQSRLNAAQNALDQARSKLQAAQDRLTQAENRLSNLQHSEEQHPNDLLHPTVSFTDGGVVVNVPTNEAASITSINLAAVLHDGSIALYNQNGEIVDHMTGGKYVHLIRQLTRNNQTFYQVSDNEKWVSASDVDIQSTNTVENQGTDNEVNKTSKHVKKTSKGKSISHKYRRIARVVKKVTLVDAKGKKTKRTLKVGTNWKVFAKKKIKGHLYYRLGTQKQWARASYMKVLKHSWF